MAGGGMRDREEVGLHGLRLVAQSVGKKPSLVAVGGDTAGGGNHEPCAPARGIGGTHGSFLMLMFQAARACFSRRSPRSGAGRYLTQNAGATPSVCTGLAELLGLPLSVTR
jgi:hypothetical protein